MRAVLARSGSSPCRCRARRVLCGIRAVIATVFVYRTSYDGSTTAPLTWVAATARGAAVGLVTPLIALGLTATEARCA